MSRIKPTATKARVVAAIFVLGVASFSFLLKSVTSVSAQSAGCPAGQFDMLQYMKGDGQQTMHTTDDQYKTTLDGVTINGKPGFYIIKNMPGDVVEEFTYDNQYIYHLKDTSWATETGNVQCNGNDAGFTLLDGCVADQTAAGKQIGTATEGSKWFPVCMAPNTKYTFPTTVTAFDKTTCQACSAPFTGCSTRVVEIAETNINGQIPIADGQKSVELANAIRVKITEGPGAGESYIYDPKYGWVGFGRTDEVTSITHEILPKLTLTSVLMCKNITPSTRLPVQREKYYIQPINGVNGRAFTLLNSGPEQLDIIRDELIMQGYEARCAAPGMKISLTEQGRSAMQKLFEQPGTNGVVLGGLGGAPSDEGGRVAKTEAMYSRLDVDYRDILVPLFRDLDLSEPNMKRSIEDFFGHKVTNDTVYTSAELKTAAINSLLTNEQRCTVAYQNLLAQDTMCKKLADPAQCALYATKIPQTSYTVETLFSAYETARAGQSPIDFCRELVGSTSAVNAKLRTGMMNSPLTIDKAYRLAFMVTTIRLRAPTASKLLNILTHPLAGWMGPPKPNHAVVVVAFKVPDLLTNKGFNNGYTTDTAYDDVGTLTKNSLITQSAQAKIETDALERRTKLLDIAREYSTVVQHDSWAEIVCLGGGVKVAGVGSPQCQDPLTKALVDIINAQVMVGKLTKPAPTPAPTGPATEWSADEAEGALVDASTTAALGFGDLLDNFSGDGELKCSEDFETAKTINDPGALTAPEDPSHVFTENWGAALLANLFGDCTHAGEGLGDPGYASTQTPETGACTGKDWYLKSKFFVVKDKLADGGGDDEDLAVKHFLVYPAGYELKTVEGVLAGSFFTKKQLSDILDLQRNKPKLTEKMVDQFQLDKSKIAFDGAEDSYSFTDANDCKTVTNAEGMTEVKCADLSFGMRLISTAPKAANILGAKLGYWMRKIQLSLNATTQESFGYLQKCATLEEFLLDRCGGTAATLKPAGQSAGTSNPGGSCSSTTTLDEIGYNDPSTLPLTGSATYYAPTVFNETLNNRKSGGRIFGNDFVGNTTLKNCEVLGDDLIEARAEASAVGQEYVGCVALLRRGDLYYKNGWGTPQHDPNNIRSVWLKNQAGVVHGPFAVLDVAAQTDAPCLYDRGWAVDIDYNSFERLFNQTAGPDKVTVCNSESC